MRLCKGEILFKVASIERFFFFVGLAWSWVHWLGKSVLPVFMFGILAETSLWY